MATNTLWQQSEIVRTKLFPFWAEADFKVLTDFIAKGEVELVGERDYRIPFKTIFGGRMGHYDNQLGDMGRGSSPQGNVMLQSFYSMRLNFEFDMMQIKATSSKKVAVQNPFVQCIADGFREFELLWDKVIHNNGTAILGTAVSQATVGTSTVYTMANTFGVQLLRRGQFYTIYDAALNVVRSSGVLYAKDINAQARTLTLSGIVPGATATDNICFEGVSGAQPAGPRGLAYWVNATTSGTTAGVNRANESQMISKTVSGTNGLTVDVVMALHDRIQMDRGEVPNLIGIVGNAQRAYAYTQMEAIQMQFIENSDKQAGLFDRLPKLRGKKFFMWGEVAHYVDIHADATQAYYIVPEDFGRAQLAPTGFFETPGKSGQDARFIQLYGASGGPAAGVWFGLTKDQDIFCTNPGEQGVITGLPLGSLYA